MVAEMDEPPSPEKELTTRVPEEAGLVALCRTLNELDAKYVVMVDSRSCSLGLPEAPSMSIC
jgi:hypothetical protein